MKLQEKMVTDKQILEVIKKYKEENLTVRRMCELIGYQSPGTMQPRIKELQKRGLIQVQRRTTIEVTDVGKKMLQKAEEG